MKRIAVLFRDSVIEIYFIAKGGDTEIGHKARAIFNSPFGVGS